MGGGSFRAAPKRPANQRAGSGKTVNSSAQTKKTPLRAAWAGVDLVSLQWQRRAAACASVEGGPLPRSTASQIVNQREGRHGLVRPGWLHPGDPTTLNQTHQQYQQLRQRKPREIRGKLLPRRRRGIAAREAKRRLCHGERCKWQVNGELKFECRVHALGASWARNPQAAAFRRWRLQVHRQK